MPGTAGFRVTNPGLQHISVVLGERCAHRQLKLDLYSILGKCSLLSGDRREFLT